MGSVDKRLYRRVELRVLSSVKNLNKNVSIDGSIVNLSLGGFQVHLTENEFPNLGDQVELTFSFPALSSDEEDMFIDLEAFEDEDFEEEEETICLLGVIRRIRRQGREDVYLGIEVRDEKERLAKMEETWLALMFEDMHGD